MDHEQSLLKRRDDRAKAHLGQYAPVWIIAETIIQDEEAVQFNVVFQHNLYGWVNRRYRYDGFNNVLYHKGQTSLKEAETLAVQEQIPYIDAVIKDIPNAYGG